MRWMRDYDGRDWSMTMSKCMGVLYSDFCIEIQGNIGSVSASLRVCVNNGKIRIADRFI